MLLARKIGFLKTARSSIRLLSPSYLLYSAAAVPLPSASTPTRPGGPPPPKAWPYVLRKSATNELRSCLLDPHVAVKRVWISGGRGIGKTSMVQRVVEGLKGEAEGPIIIAFDFGEVSSATFELMMDKLETSLKKQILTSLTHPLLPRQSQPWLTSQGIMEEVESYYEKLSYDFPSLFKDFAHKSQFSGICRPSDSHTMLWEKCVNASGSGIEGALAVLKSFSVFLEERDGGGVGEATEHLLGHYAVLLGRLGRAFPSQKICFLAYHVDVPLRSPNLMTPRLKRKDSAPVKEGRGVKSSRDVVDFFWNFFPAQGVTTVCESDDALSTLWYAGEGGKGGGRMRVKIIEVEELTKDAVSSIFIPRFVDDPAHVEAIWGSVGGWPAYLEKLSAEFNLARYDAILLDQDEKLSDKRKKDEGGLTYQGKKLTNLEIKRAQIVRNITTIGALKQDFELFQWQVNELQSCPAMQQLRRALRSDVPYRVVLLETIRYLLSRARPGEGGYGAIMIPSGLPPTEISHPVILGLLHSNLMHIRWGGPFRRLQFQGRFVMSCLDDWLVSEVEKLSMLQRARYNVLLVNSRGDIKVKADRMIFKDTGWTSSSLLACISSPTMSKGRSHGMPFIILNFGGEMLYILQQRLLAQAIPDHRTGKVLGDVIKAMLNEGFIKELFEPQPLYSLPCIQQIFDRLAHSSFMRLNHSSMDKLFDLMCMGVKFQTLSAAYPEELSEVTGIHLQALEQMLELGDGKEEIMPLFCSVRKKLEEVYGSFSSHDWISLRSSLASLLQDKRVKVSLFLQDNLQTPEGEILFPPGGRLSPGCLVPGSYTLYNEEGKVTTEDKFELPHSEKWITDSGENGFLPLVNFSNPRTHLGLNCYSLSKDGNILKTVDKDNGAGLEGAVAAEAQNIEDQSRIAKRLSKELYSKAAVADISLLASLIQPSAEVEDNFKLNLFPNLEEKEGKRKGKREQDDFVLLGAREDKSHKDRILQLSASLEMGKDGDEGKEEEKGEIEDLLDLLPES